MAMPTYTIKEGYERNPLRQYRNIPCPCGSRKKAKRCCGRFDALPVELVEALRKYLRSIRAMGFVA